MKGFFNYVSLGGEKYIAQWDICLYAFDEQRFPNNQCFAWFPLCRVESAYMI